MGYSTEHNYEWDDFQCDNYVPSNVLVSYLCEGLQIDLYISFIIIFLRLRSTATIKMILNYLF